ncbi:hypothetical protein F5887DRAFT_947773 [Amanita rubescens]|nr:hypothetical protein F5887DRAFT_947773 [Amanita rubescens]
MLSLSLLLWASSPVMIPSSAIQRGTRTGSLQRHSEISETVHWYIKPEAALMRTHISHHLGSSRSENTLSENELLGHDCLEFLSASNAES